MTSSNISDSVYSANIPDVTNFSAEFVYNYWTRDERINSPDFNEYNKTSIDKWPRYVSLTWDLPVRKTFSYFTEVQPNIKPKGSKGPISNPVPEKSPPIATTSNFDFASNFEESVDTILPTLLSEDDDFSPQYITQNFSDIASISQGAADLNNYATLVNSNILSNNKKQKQIIQNLIDANLVKTKEFQDNLKKVTEAYDVLSDFPADIFGLNVFETGTNNAAVVQTDNRDFFKSLASSLLINYKIHKLVLPDFIISDESLKNPDVYKKFATAYEESKQNSGKTSTPKVFAFKKNSAPENAKVTAGPAIVKGYLIFKYRKDSNGLVKDDVFYINDGQKNSFIDTQVLYGKTYVYSISVVCELDLLGKIQDDGVATTDDYEKLTVNLSSRPSSVSIDCLEISPPPPPADINFLFDYVNKKVIMHWDFPVNPQHDIKQFQVLRRKNIDQPFELIAQYGFDDSSTGENDSLYLTGERVDANNIQNMEPDLRYLASVSKGPVYRHVDNDFVVDTEFFETTSFIYAFCSIDAHGMISNYSTQYEVKFDPFKNKLFTRVICDEGSPRAYPNMNLKIDTFKDSINVGGDQTKQIKIYFSPEYLSVQSERGDLFKVAETVNSTEFDNAFYLLQFMNLDNQKTETLKMKVVRPIKPVPIPNITFPIDVPVFEPPPNFFEPPAQLSNDQVKFLSSNKISISAQNKPIPPKSFFSKKLF